LIYKYSAKCVFTLYINIQLFNLKGEKIKVISNKIFKQGFHKLLIDGSFLTSGVYLLKIKSDQIERTLKLYLIK